MDPWDYFQKLTDPQGATMYLLQCLTIFAVVLSNHRWHWAHCVSTLVFSAFFIFRVLPVQRESGFIGRGPADDPLSIHAG